MTSPYLDRPLLPLAVVLPQMLEDIQTELANEKLEAAEERHLRRRAELIRGLLTPSRITEPAVIESGAAGSGLAPRVWAVLAVALSASRRRRSPRR